MSLQAGTRLKNSRYGRVLATTVYLLALFSGAISFIWNCARLVLVFDPSDSSRSLPIWKIIVVPLIVLSMASLVLTYVLQQQVENRFLKLQIGVLVLAVLAIIVMWVLNIGLDRVLEPLIAD